MTHGDVILSAHFGGVIINTECSPLIWTDQSEELKTIPRRTSSEMGGR